MAQFQVKWQSYNPQHRERAPVTHSASVTAYSAEEAKAKIRMNHENSVTSIRNIVAVKIRD